jgi:hypothetical protein
MVILIRIVFLDRAKPALTNEKVTSVYQKGSETKRRYDGARKSVIVYDVQQ